MFSQKQYGRAAHWRNMAGKKRYSLTEQQRKVLCLATKGMQNAKIAQEPEAATKNMAHHMTEIKKALSHQGNRIWIFSGQNKLEISLRAVFGEAIPR